MIALLISDFEAYEFFRLIVHLSDFYLIEYYFHADFERRGKCGALCGLAAFMSEKVIS